MKTIPLICIFVIFTCAAASCHNNAAIPRATPPDSTPMESAGEPDVTVPPPSTAWIQEIEVFAKKNEDRLRNLLAMSDRLPENMQVTSSYFGEAAYFDHIGWVHKNRVVSLDEALRLEGVDEDLYESLLKEFVQLDILGVRREPEGSRIRLFIVAPSMNNSLVVDLSDVVPDGYRQKLPDRGVDRMEVPDGWWRVTLENGFYVLLSRN